MTETTKQGSHKLFINRRTAMSEAIFCNACQLSVPADDKNSHYNLEWHRCVDSLSLRPFVGMSRSVCSAGCFSLSRDGSHTMLHFLTLSHRFVSYNVKRKCASLPPVPRGLFESKVAALTQASSTPLVEASFSCKVCKYVTPPCNNTCSSVVFAAWYVRHSIWVTPIHCVAAFVCVGVRGGGCEDRGDVG